VTNTTDRPASRVFHAVTHVWGRAYLDTFLNVCIPNQLAAGNVPALPAGSRYRILTRADHVPELDEHPMVRALREVMPVDLVVVDALDRPDARARSYDLMNACHQRAMADALEAGAALIMLSADIVMSDHALGAVVRRHREGYRAVVTTGLRLAKESFLQSLDRAGARLSALPSRDLVRMALPHLHQQTRSMFVAAPAFSAYPSAVYWPVGDKGLLARCFHLHPLMVDPVRAVTLGGTYDDHYLSEACPDFSRVHVVTDSDELQLFELTSTNQEFRTTRRAGASAWQAAALASGCDALQLRYWSEQPVYIHAADVGDAWSVPAAEADAFVARVLRRRPYSGIARPWLKWSGDVEKIRVRYAKFWHRQARRLRAERLRRWSERQVRTWERQWPRPRLKPVQRPVRVWFHRVTKAGKVGLKRLRRARVFPTG
jgi:hypothetical protein